MCISQQIFITPPQMQFYVVFFSAILHQDSLPFSGMGCSAHDSQTQIHKKACLLTQPLPQKT